MAYKFRNQEIIGIIQIFHTEVPSSFLERLETSITPTFKDTDGHLGENIYNIDLIEEGLQAPHGDSEEHLKVIAGLKDAANLYNMCYVQFTVC